MITLNLSPETQAALEKLAATNNRTIEEQAELTLSKYVSEEFIESQTFSEYEGIYKPEPQELAELLETVAEYEAQKATGLRITHDDIKQRVADRLAQYKLQHEQVDN